MVSGEAPQWMCGRRRPVFPTHPAQGMGWVQLVRHGWAWGNLGRLNAALGMRLTEDVEAKRSLHNNHSCGVATPARLPWEPSSLPRPPWLLLLSPTSASGSPGKQEGIAFREAEALSSGPHSRRTPNTSKGALGLSGAL